MSAETPRKASQCVHASKPLNYLWPLCSLLAARCLLLAPPCLLLDQLHLPVHLLDSRVQCPVLACELVHLLLHLSHINHTHILDLTACVSILRCARLCCHVGIQLSPLECHVSECSRICVCFSSNMVCVLVLLTHRMSQSIRSRMPLAETRSSFGSSTGWLPSCTRTTRRSRCISCSYRRCASARSANASASSMRSRDCSGCLFITCVSTHTRTESYYDSRYMSECLELK